MTAKQMVRILATQRDSPTFVLRELTTILIQDREIQRIIEKYKKAGIIVKENDSVMIPFCSQCGIMTSWMTIHCKTGKITIRWDNIQKHYKAKHSTRYSELTYVYDIFIYQL